MRLIIQRVSRAEVSIDNKIKSKINKGLLVLLGIEETDEAEDIDWLVAKVAKLRIFADEKGLMNLSVNDIGGQLMVISQFTLHASTKKGNRPSFIRASKPESAIPLYNAFIEKLSMACNQKVETGNFGAMMQVSLINDGPVTIFIDSKNKE